MKRTLLGGISGVNPDKHNHITEWKEAILVTPEFFSDANARSDGEWELPFVCDGLVLRYQTTLGAAEARGIKELKLAFVDAVEE